MSEATPLLPPLLRLPPELQLEILTHLPLLDQLIATQVCLHLRRLLSTKIFAQTHYFPVSLSAGRSKPSSESLHSAFPRTHFLLEESTSEGNGSLIFTLRGGKAVRYIYVPGHEYTEQEGELWNGEIDSLDAEIRDALKKRLVDGESSTSSVSNATIPGNEGPSPGDPLDIDYDDWNAPTVVFFAENKFVSRFTGGRDLTNTSALDEPFISPFIDVQNAPDENEAMKFIFELDIYKDELLKGPDAPSSKKWEEKMVFKRTATVRDWIHRCLSKMYAVAISGGTTADETVWASVQVGRVWNEDAWSITAAILRVSDEARRQMVWVRRKNGHFLLIKKNMWDERADWDWNKREDQEGKAGAGDQKDGLNVNGDNENNTTG
ncbi:hypothetical protein TWF730_002854 [Orbilia blumenaviensis]|uniref:F-box domain-containing protein n=1 Tax=Orbilia blumenaviensis TaxID=1796055 RepID=A0AAV9U7C0_9PEZI